MITAGICMMKNESDVADHVILHMADEGLKFIIVADNMSTDKTREKLESTILPAKQLGCEVIIVDDLEVGYEQSKKMSALSEQAANLGADWIVPFDADEIWLSKQDRIGVVLNDLPPSVDVVKADLYNHFPSAVDPAGKNPFETIGWRQNTVGVLPKIAFKWRSGAVVGMGNHDVRFPDGRLMYCGHKLEIRHFPYRTFAQFINKAVQGAEAYKATDLSEDYGRHWRNYAQIYEQYGAETLREVFTTYFWFLSPIDAGLVYDPAPFRRWTH